MAEYTAELADNPQPGTSTGTETKVSRKRYVYLYQMKRVKNVVHIV